MDDNWEPLSDYNEAAPRLDLRHLFPAPTPAPVEVSPIPPVVVHEYAPPPATAPEAWPEMDMSLLEDSRGTVPAFPLEILPPSWARWAGDTAVSTGAPVDYVVQGLFAALAAICGAGVQVKPQTGWSESLVLWQALVGSPSSGKSPALSAMRRQVAQLEDEQRAQDIRRRNQHAAKVEEAGLIAQRWKKACEEAVTAGRSAPDRPEGASFDEVFVPSQMVVADATVEALADVVAGNPRGVIMWRDELTAWLANLGRYASGGTDRGHWLEAWGGSSVTINRRSRLAPLHLPRFPVSIVGTIQPDRIADAFAGSDDGLAARFLYSWPEPTPFVPLLQRPAPNDDEALAMLQRIAAIVGQADTPLRLSFDNDALERLNAFLERIHPGGCESDGLETGWVGKGNGTVVRLAGILTLLRWSDSTAQGAPRIIPRDAVEDAAALWSDYFRPHARAVFNQAGRADRDRLSRRALAAHDRPGRDRPRDHPPRGAELRRRCRRRRARPRTPDQRGHPAPAARRGLAQRRPADAAVEGQSRAVEGGVSAVGASVWQGGTPQQHVCGDGRGQSPRPSPTPSGPGGALNRVSPAIP